MNISVDWLALIISVVALLGSGAALYQTSRFRHGNKVVEASRLAAEIGEKLGAMATSVPSIKSNWAALLAANGNYHSGARIQIENELDQALADVGSLRDRLGKIGGDFAKLSHADLERRMIELWSLNLAADRVGAGIADREAKHAEGVASRRRMMESGKPV